MTTTYFKGQEFTKADVVNAMEIFDSQYRNSFPAKRWKTYAIEYNGKLYPPKETLRLVVGYKDIGPGGKPVNSRFQELGFRIVTLTDAEDDGPEAIEEDAIETSISLERDLEEYLTNNLAMLEPGLKPYSSETYGFRQVDTKAVGVIDLLGVDRQNRLVVLELKAGEADDRVCGQIQRYMGWVQETLAGTTKVRGIIVANQFTASLKYAVKVAPNIALKRYTVSFKFSDI